MQELAQKFQQSELSFALAGALAVAVHGHVRATQDIDTLIAASDLERADQLMRELGYRQVYCTTGVATYVRTPVAALPAIEERCDLLLARRALGLEAIEQARRQRLRWEGMSLPVVPVASLILMKLVAIAADPARPNDRADVRALLNLHRGKLDLTALRAEAAALGETLALELDALVNSPGVGEESGRYAADIGGF